MKRFEYCYIPFIHNYKDRKQVHFSKGIPKDIKEGERRAFAKVLDELGEDGWEMVGCGNTNEYVNTIYFKREIIE